MENKKRILIVEDETPQRDALKAKLSHEGYEVLEAKDGEEGLAIAIKERPDLIVLDIMLPKIDGLEAARRLREDEWGKNAKVLILSNAGDTEKVQHAMECEVFEYMLKSDSKLEDVALKVKELLSETS